MAFVSSNSSPLLPRSSFLSPSTCAARPTLLFAPRATMSAANPSAGRDRRQESFRRRVEAAELARSRPHPASTTNGDETRFRDTEGRPNYLGSFTKGLAHDGALLRDPSVFPEFVRAINSGVPGDLAAIRIGIPDDEPWASVVARGDPGAGRKGRAGVRGWESASAGLAFDLEGPDAQALAMPPAPGLGSRELSFEIGELYTMALARDIPFIEWEGSEVIADAVRALNETRYISARSSRRLRRRTVFRGIGPGTKIGPYISQFMLQGSATLGGSREDGIVMYGAQELSLKVVRVEQFKDWMTTSAAWLDVQNGADVGDAQGPDFETDPWSRTKFISTPRDLATYVHFDALYQAYLNACLVMLAEGVPFDEGLPFRQDDSIDSQQPFATFGGPHILSLVTEVATRALKAVRFQKFNIHRRIRPEAVAGLINLQAFPPPCMDVAEGFGPEVTGIVCDIREELSGVLFDVMCHNEAQNNKFADRRADGDSEGTFLLPMAFPEGSPMHPTYGAGHATVAGACVTMLKAFFDSKSLYPGQRVVQASADGHTLVDTPVRNGERLTIEGELNKLAANISVGRSFAGVHYASDNAESMLLGEQVAIGILQEQKLMFGEQFSMSVPLFNGETLTI